MHMLQKKEREPAPGDRSRPNQTGLSDSMKQALEQKTGLPMDDVRVFRNSSRPMQFQASAITEGSQVYLGPGQERHLMHELGHVVQQKMGMVRATRMEQGRPVNDDAALERQADEFHL